MKDIILGVVDSLHHRSFSGPKAAKPSLRLSVQHLRSASSDDIHRARYGQKAEAATVTSRRWMVVNGQDFDMYPNNSSSAGASPSSRSSPLDTKPLPAPPRPPRPPTILLPDLALPDPRRGEPWIANAQDTQIILASGTSDAAIIRAHSPLLSNSPGLGLAIHQASKSCGASTASPATISSVSEGADEVASSPVTSVSDKVSSRSSSLYTPSRTASAPSLAENTEMVEVNSEAKRVAQILAGRVQKLERQLTERDNFIKKLQSELRGATGADHDDGGSSLTDAPKGSNQAGSAEGLAERQTQSDDEVDGSAQDNQALQGRLVELEHEAQQLRRSDQQKDEKIDSLEKDLSSSQREVDDLEKRIARLVDAHGHPMAAVGAACDSSSEDGEANTHRCLSEAFDEVERQLAVSEAAVVEGLQVRKSTSSDAAHDDGCRPGDHASGSGSEAGSEEILTAGLGIRYVRGSKDYSKDYSNGSGIETWDGRSHEIEHLHRRIRDLQDLGDKQAEDIRWYKLDVKGYKKDVRQQEGKIRELQARVLELQRKLDEAEGQVLLSDVPLGIDVGSLPGPSTPSAPLPMPANSWLEGRTASVVHDAGGGRGSSASSIASRHVDLAYAHSYYMQGPWEASSDYVPRTPELPESAGMSGTGRAGPSRHHSSLHSRLARLKTSGPWNVSTAIDPIIEEESESVLDGEVVRGDVEGPGLPALAFVGGPVEATMGPALDTVLEPAGTRASPPPPSRPPPNIPESQSPPLPRDDLPPAIPARHAEHRLRAQPSKTQLGDDDDDDDNSQVMSLTYSSSSSFAPLSTACFEGGFGRVGDVKVIMGEAIRNDDPFI